METATAGEALLAALILAGKIAKDGAFERRHYDNALATARSLIQDTSGFKGKEDGQAGEGRSWPSEAR